MGTIETGVCMGMKQHFGACRCQERKKPPLQRHWMVLRRPRPGWLKTATLNCQECGATWRSKIATIVWPDGKPFQPGAYCPATFPEWAQLNAVWQAYDAAGDDYVPIGQWSKDHWSTLAYLETVTVDYRGLVDNRRMRCNPRLHRPFAHFDCLGVVVDGSRYPTRIESGDIQRHDDWSCLEDLVAAGLVTACWRMRYPERSFGGAQMKVELTDQGRAIAAALRAHKARGGMFGDFDPTAPRSIELPR